MTFFQSHLAVISWLLPPRSFVVMFNWPLHLLLVTHTDEWIKWLVKHFAPSLFLRAKSRSCLWMFKGLEHVQRRCSCRNRKPETNTRPVWSPRRFRLGNELKSVVHRKEQHFTRSAEKLFTLLSLVGHALIAKTHLDTRCSQIDTSRILWPKHTIIPKKEKSLFSSPPGEIEVFLKSLSTTSSSSPPRPPPPPPSALFVV